MINGNRLMSIAEAREMLGGIGRTSVYELIKSRDIARVHIGRRAFITSASVDAYIDRLNAARSGSGAA